MLFEPLQDIDVFVEDTDDEVFYRTLLNFATRQQVKIARVFSLNGRSSVINAASSHDHRKRRAAFIIDGDLSWVKGEPAPAIKGLHRHEAYCIENLLICEKAIAFILTQEIVVSDSTAFQMLQFQSWRNSILTP